MNPSSTYVWYSQLIKPFWAPPRWIFSPVWTALYLIIIISFSLIFYKVIVKKIHKQILFPLVLNLVFNLLFTPIQFGLRNNLLALFDILLVLSTLLWTFICIFKNEKKERWFVYVNIPYLLWVSFATLLQFSITVLNY